MKHIILTPENTEQALQTARAILAKGGLLIYPTETMYGVGVDAKSSLAVSKLLKFKNRPAGKAISVLVENQTAAEELVELNETARKLYAAFLPGPLTVISQDKGMVDLRLLSELGTLGIRISSHPLAQELATFGPLTATSANASGAARPYSIETALAGLSEVQKAQIDLILDAGELPHNEPSTVIDTTQDVQTTVRIGALAGQLLQEKQTSSEEETLKLAEQFTRSILASRPDRPVIIALDGQMGAGKTHFAKGVGRALGIQVPITSPSYTLINEYDGLIHMDLWRLTDFDAEALEMARYLQPGQVILIEWPTPAIAYLKEQPIIGYYVGIETDGETGRRLTFREL